MDRFNLKVYTPLGLALEENVRTVTLPSSQGEIGVLPRHQKYIGLLGTGILECQSVDAHTARRLVISGGCCHFSNDTLTVLADAVDFPDTLDRDTYAAERKELTEFIKAGSLDDPERIHAQQKLERIKAIDRLISH